MSVVLVVMQSNSLTITSILGYMVLAEEPEDTTESEENGEHPEIKRIDLLVDGWGGIFEDAAYPESGGNYPSDPSLRLRAEMIELCEEIANRSGMSFNPAYIYGIGIRETGPNSYYRVDAERNPSIYTSLTMSTNPTGRGTNNAFNKNGHSLYVGGTMAGGRDTGNPQTMKFNSSEELYKSLSTNGYADVAVGPFAFEIRYIYKGALSSHLFNSSKMRDTGVRKISSDSEVGMDAELNIMRPNPLFLPDSVYSVMSYHTDLNSRISTKISTLAEGTDYSKLNSEQKSKVIFACVSAAYGWGEFGSKMEDIYKELIRELSAAQSKGVQIDAFMGKEYYNEETLTLNANSGDIRGFVRSKAKSAGINLDTSVDAYWMGLYAMNFGKAEWDALKKIISKAQSSGGSGGGTGGSGGDSDIGGENGNEIPATGAVYLPVRPSKNSDGEYFVPLITSQFGMRSIYPNNHTGIDVARAGGSAKGAPIYSVATGTVSSAGYTSMKGNYATIQISAKGHTSYVTYMHMENDAYVIRNGIKQLLKNNIGTMVSGGEIIGKIGDTGNVTGAHLHLEIACNSEDLIVRKNGKKTSEFGKFVPPFQYLFGENIGVSFLKSSGYEYMGYNEQFNGRYKSVNQEYIWSKSTLYDLMFKNN